MKMSSKTALIKALEIIELSENTDEKMLIIEQLNALIQEYSNTKWTKELIFKRIDEWVEINGVNPLHKDFQRKGLPKPITVEAHFNTKLSDFIKKYYPQNRKCINSKCSFSNQELIDIFIEQYNKI